MAFDTPYQLLLHLKQQFDESDAAAQLARQRKVQCILFKVADHAFMTPVHDVIEIIPRAHLHDLPGVQTWVTGLIQVRGELIIVNDLGAFLYAKATRLDEHSRILIIEAYGEKVGFLLSSIQNIHWIDDSQTIDLQDQMCSSVPYIKKAHVDEQGQIPIIDLKTLVQHPSFLQASKVV